MDRKRFLKPFVASVAALIGTQVGATPPTDLDRSIVEAVQGRQPSAELGLTLSNATHGEQFAAHGSHVSHSSHSSHASHSSHSSSSF